MQFLTIVRYCQILSYLIITEEDNFTKVLNHSLMRAFYWAFKLTQLDLLIKNSSNGLLVAILILGFLLMLAYLLSLLTTSH